MKASEIRQKSTEDLAKELGELHKEQFAYAKRYRPVVT
jgi:large subunit ribosomal protein L29